MNKIYRIVRSTNKLVLPSPNVDHSSGQGGESNHSLGGQLEESQQNPEKNDGFYHSSSSWSSIRMEKESGATPHNSANPLFHLQDQLLWKVQDVHHDGDVPLTNVGVATLHMGVVRTVRIWVFTVSMLFSESRSSINQTRQDFIAWRHDEATGHLSNYKCNALLLYTGHCQYTLTTASLSW